MDEGKGMLKLAVYFREDKNSEIVDDNCSDEKEKCTDESCNDNENVNVRVKVKSMKDEKVKEASVKQSFLLACVKDVPESWANCKTILEKTKTNSMIAKWVLDFKLGNIIVGLQNHSSKHCCEYCKAFRNESGE